MAARVLSTDQAKSAIQQVQGIINGGLVEQITKLDAQGKILSNPDVWDGPLAQQFRDSTWPETKSALDKAHTELDQLREQLQKIATNIMTAGGGS